MFITVDNSCVFSFYQVDQKYEYIMVSLESGHDSLDMWSGELCALYCICKRISMFP